MNEPNKSIWWRLSDAWTSIAKWIPYMFIPFAGYVFIWIIFIEEIGILIKLNELKREISEIPKTKDVFKNYLIGFLVPIVGPFFTIRAINNIMKFLEDNGVEQNGIQYIEKKGRFYAYLGLIGQILSFAILFIYPYFLFPFINRTATSEFTLFVIIFAICYGVTLFVLVIIFTIMRFRILKRLVKSINSTKLIEKPDMI